MTTKAEYAKYMDDLQQNCDETKTPYPPELNQWLRDNKRIAEILKEPNYGRQATLDPDPAERGEDHAPPTQ